MPWVARVDLARIGLGVGDHLRTDFAGNFGVTTSAFGMRAMTMIFSNSAGSKLSLRIEILIDDKRRRRRRQERIAVGLGLVGELGADIAGSARPVFDDDRVTHLRASHSPTTRGTTSAEPPAGNGTMILTGRDGYSCALAGSDAAMAMSSTAMPRLRPMRHAPARTRQPP